MITGIGNRNNLAHMYDGNVKIMDLKEGEYISADNVKLLGKTINLDILKKVNGESEYDLAEINETVALELIDLEKERMVFI